MKLKTLAELAAVGGFLIVVLQYMKVEPNAIDELPSLVQESANSDVAKLSLDLNEAAYLESGSLAYPMYKAAMSISHRPDKGEALAKAVDIALKEKDYKLAVLAASNITYAPDMNSALTQVADNALLNRDTIGFALIAAEYISYSPDKSKVLQKVNKIYEHLAGGGKLNDPDPIYKIGDRFI